MTRYTDNIVIYNILHTCYIARNDEDDTIRLCPFWNRENARHRYNVWPTYTYLVQCVIYT